MPLVLWTLTNSLSMFSMYFWYGICHIHFFPLPNSMPLNHQFDECLGLFCVRIRMCERHVFLGVGLLRKWKHDSHERYFEFNKVLAFFFYFDEWTQKKVVHIIGRMFSSSTHSYKHFDKRVNKIPVQLLFFCQHHDIYTHTHTYSDTVKSLLSLFVCRVRLR